MVSVKDYTCLEPYVGLRGVCEDIEAPLYINDLPGIEARTLVDTATVEDLTGQESFKTLRREAAVRTGRDFLQKLSEKYDVADTVDRLTVGDIDTTVLVDSGKFTLYRNEPQVELHLEVIKIWVSQAGNVDLTINGTAQQSLSVTQGYNSFQIEGISGDEIEVVLTGVNGVQLGSLTTHSCDCGGNASMSGYGVAIVTFSLRCDHILCLFAESLAFATRYMTAVLLMDQVELSDRKNPLARNSKESAGRIRARILGTKDPVTDLSNSSLYWAEIGTAVKNAVLSGPCVTCNTTRWIEQIP